MTPLDPLTILRERRNPPPHTDQPDEQHPEQWLRAFFPRHVTHDFADHQDQFWTWVWSIQLGEKPDEAFIGIWPRGGAKSTSAELAVVALGARRRRRYVLYVCEAQDQADDHVANIASLLESRAVSDRYPLLADRLLGKFGNSKGWRRNRLRTAAGLTVDALGLDSAARGAKLDEQRPDLIVLDDLDNEHDTPLTTERKIATLTKALLPAGADDLAVLAIQNLVHADSIFARLADGRADFLGRRQVSGPIPAVEELAYDAEQQPDGSTRFVITGGTATWEGQNLTVCQSQIDEWGLTAFLGEAQHDTAPPAGGMYDHVTFEHRALEQLPDLVRVVVWVDPAVTNTDASDSHAYQCDGIDEGGVIFRLESWEDRTSPEDSLRRAIRCALRWEAEKVGVETDQGGDTWRSVFREACRAVADEDGVALDVMPRFDQDKAGRQKAERGSGQPSKTARNARMLADYERPGRIIHVVGSHGVLERSLRRFPKRKPFDLADAAFWSWRDLRGAVRRGGVSSRAGAPPPVPWGTPLDPATGRPPVEQVEVPRRRRGVTVRF